MSLFPALATVDLLPQADQYPVITPTVVVLHTNGGPGNPQQIRRYFAGRGVFSHFDVGWDGRCVQMQDTSREAPAEYAANRRAVSIETQDDGDATRPWSLPQLATIIALLRALTAAHSIPAVLCPSANGSGIGYHQQYPEWNRSAHDCPGPVRVRQLFTTVLPALASAPAPAPTPSPGADVQPAALIKTANDPAIYKTGDGIVAKRVLNPRTLLAEEAAGLVESHVRIVDPDVITDLHII